MPILSAKRYPRYAQFRGDRPIRSQFGGGLDGRFHQAAVVFDVPQDRGDVEEGDAESFHRLPL